MYKFNSADFSDYCSGIQKEWLVTNGLGGYASSTIIGANTRTYHGLLVSALNPPVDRTLMLSSVDEEIYVNGSLYRLATHKYPMTVHPEGYKYLNEVSFKPFPAFVYQVENTEIIKQIFMQYGENTTIISYQVNCSDNNTVFRLIPLVNLRNFHYTTRSNDIKFEQSPVKYGTKIVGKNQFFHLHSNIKYTPEDVWYYNLEYDMERYRGLEYQEDNYNPGFFELNLGKGENNIFIAASTNGEISNQSWNDIKDIYENEIKRANSHGYIFEKDFPNQLSKTADSFIVNRKSTNSESIVAGYHWFSDWGRDAMISLPGLTLVTGRFNEASRILKGFAANCQDGLIPNRFADTDNDNPDYNTVDASLWFIHAAGKYFEYTSDLGTIRDVWNTIREIIHHYIRGTYFNIQMDKDSLIKYDSQLTWMDAKVDGIEVTPRRGKTCEINALWYNALKTASLLAENLGLLHEEYDKTADRVKSSFVDTFWNDNNGCLFDCISIGDDGEIYKDPSIRPNQIFAVSLPYTMLSHDKEKMIVDKVKDKLLTSKGLRTLSPEDEKYRGIYSGGPYERDFAYHNGTVWPWLMGPFIDAYLKVNNDSVENREYARSLLLGFENHFKEAGIGTISEVFDGDYPHNPGGCVSQAWSVAEILRAYVENFEQIF
ncbi:glycogen debranching enzyme [Methanohalobium evestigatum Z-7303]|uniref:Glycogen debranching enzyme n=1 Tax=Methanohalobium evestigatum (strain ATCC BAA-1072 / DSM 3721 / NBRC 107634 / OCM 161 / Z-7303) TaxID=644295 RepID=D7E9B3_METEZ|nr:amylo-alpha-1,6-glucosidase [Methanohalobium evestigatum]ADI74185.1 glycogen debranching enzyme [Methanohalobium evestigatum Z-7303]